MAPTPTAEKATATKKQQQQHKASRADHSHANNNGKMVQSREGRSEPSSPEKAWSEQHAGHCKQQQRRQPCCSAFSITVLILSILVVLVALGGPRAAKDERVRAAVSDSVQRLNSTLITLNTTLAEQFDVRLDGLLERLANLSDTVSNFMGDEGPRPGQVAAAEGLRAHHPIIIIPGFVTSGLELWQGEECAQSYFRQRLWGTLSMAQTLLADRACWMRHMKLDPLTGSDPPGIKLRAAKALEAVDYFVPGYWVFSKMVQSLADLGYDNNNMVAVPYDWRLPMEVMESRDGYFSRVKQEVEMQYQLSQEIKPLLVSHSYGAQVTLAFLHWVDKQNPGWVDKYLKGYVNLAGPMLGLPKSLSPLLSGETRETVDMMAGLAVLVEQYLGKQSRAALFRTWGSPMAMLPIGGPKVWGNATFAPDDDSKITAAGRSYGGLIALVRSTDANLRDAVRRNDSSLISNDSLNFLTTTLSNWGNMVKYLGAAAGDDDDEQDDENSSETDGKKNNQSSNNKSDKTNKGKAIKKGKREKQAYEEKSNDNQESSDVGQRARHEDQQDPAEGQETVRFLDVHSAILSLAMTGGEQLTVNLQRWFAGASSLNLAHILAHHRKAASKAAEQRTAACQVQDGDYSGTCQNSDAENATSDSDTDGSKGPQQKHAAGSAEGDADDDSVNGDKRDSLGLLADVIGDGDKQDCKGSGCKGGGRGGGCSTRDTEGSTRGRDHEVRPVDPVTTPLPKAPGFKLYCFYGIGVPTERGYHYLKTRRNGATEWSINNMVNEPDSGLLSGVQLSPDGDGTVPLLSLGALCAGGWKTKRLNPAGMEVVVREYPNKPEQGLLKDARGGPGASTHVEILGNEDMLLDLMQIAAGQGDGMSEVYHTDIRRIADRIPWDEL